MKNRIWCSIEYNTHARIFHEHNLYLILDVTATAVVVVVGSVVAMPSTWLKALPNIIKCIYAHLNVCLVARVYVHVYVCVCVYVWLLFISTFLLYHFLLAEYTFCLFCISPFIWYKYPYIRVRAHIYIIVCYGCWWCHCCCCRYSYCYNPCACWHINGSDLVA